MSKQQNLSTFFSTKIEAPVKLRQGWVGNDSNRGASNYGDSTEQSRKRVLPASVGGANRDSNFSGMAPKPFKSSYPSSAAYGAPKGTIGIGGVPFVSPAGIQFIIR